MRHLLHLLRDLEAAITGYGQCLRCHRSWRHVASVSVWHSPTEATFLLCMDCWSDIVGEGDPHAGLILQGYADTHLIRHPRPTEGRNIMAAYGMAWRVGVEWRPAWRRPMMFDVRPMLGERRRITAGQAIAARPEVGRVYGKRFDLMIEDDMPGFRAEPMGTSWSRGGGLTEEEAARWDRAVESGEAVERLQRLVEGKPGFYDGNDVGEPTLTPPGINPETGMRYARGEDPMDAPGWNGAGSDTEQGDMEANRG